MQQGSIASQVNHKRHLQLTTDQRNLLLIILGFTLLVLLLPPSRDYPVSDEGIYVPTLRNFSANLVYHQPDMTLTNLVGLIWLGWLWTSLFGFSFTAIAALMLTLSLLGLLGFYLLLRELEVMPSAALLAVALLGFNPLYLHLSYIFLTEVPFLTLLFYACLCYLRGLRGKGEVWLWLGSVLVGYDFLIRQYAALIPLALLLYLFLAQRWNWRTVAAATIPAAVAIAAFLAWQHGHPPNHAAFLQRNRLYYVFTPAWPAAFFGQLFTNLPLLGLFVVPLLARRWLVLTWAILIGLVYIILLNHPPTGDTFFSIPFNVTGNLIKRDGLDFYAYDSSPIFNDAIWSLVLLVGIALGALLLASLSERLLTWAQPLHSWRKRLPRVTIVYIFGLFAAAATFALGGWLYDRYVLAFLPALLVFRVRDSQVWSKWAWGYAIAATVFLASFSLLLQADYNDHAAARWTAGQSLIAQGAKPDDIWAGFEWVFWYGTSEDEQKPYLISDQGRAGYTLLRQIPYYTRLGGFTTNAVGVWRRNDIAPLPQSSP